ncbi:MAG: LPS assembly lipoprotein LptE [Lentisphaeria bacterium]|nr:LPS assembly lipoprotein LptE [Lentisphaeria bacterium]
MSKWIPASSLLCLVLILSSCSSYKLGNQPIAGIKSIAVAKVVDTTNEPRAAITLQKAIRGQIVNDASIPIKPPYQADATIYAIIKSFSSSGISARKNISEDDDQETYSSNQWQMSATISFKLITRKGEVLAEVDQIIGTSEYPDALDLTTFKENAQKLALKQAAYKLSTYVLNPWEVE